MKSEKSSTTQINSNSLKGERMFTSIKKFGFGIGWGLFIVAIYWSFSVYFHSSIPLATGIIASLVFSLGCGLITLKVGYEPLDKIINSLPF